jgi:hypothetical protein
LNPHQDRLALTRGKGTIAPLLAGFHGLPFHRHCDITDCRR